MWTESDKSGSHRGAIILGLFAIAILSVYLPALQNGFMNFDDHAYVTGNPPVRAGLTYGGLIWAFTAVHSYNWHPLTWLSHMLDVQLFGLNPWGHHLVNVLFHVANSLLLFGILWKLTAAFWRSLFVAALFAFHPLHVESVAWIAERKDVLSTFFAFLAIWAYVDFARSSKTSRYLLVLLCFVLSLLAKQMFVTLPFLLLLLDFWPLSRWPSGKADTDGLAAKPGARSLSSLIMEKVPLLIVIAVSSAATYYVQANAGAINKDTPLLLNMGNALISYVKYIAKMFWPYPLAAMYPFDPDEITYLNVIGGGMLLSAVTYFAFRQGRRRPYLIVGWLWYVVTLVPVIGLLRIGDHAMADRYTYVPLIGLFIAVTWGANELIQKLRVHKGLVVISSVVVLSALSLVTVKQVTYWKDDIVLFEHAIAVTEENAPAHKRLGNAYATIMNVEKATSELRTARMLHFRYLAKVRPGDFDVRFSLGTAYMELGRYDEAINEYLLCAELNPKSPRVHNNLGVVYYNMGLMVQARQEFVKAIILNPAYEEAAHNLQYLEKALR